MEDGPEQFSVEAYAARNAAVESLSKRLVQCEADLKRIEADKGELWTQKAIWFVNLPFGSAYYALPVGERTEANAMAKNEDIMDYYGLCCGRGYLELKYGKALKNLEQYKEAFHSGEKDGKSHLLMHLLPESQSDCRV